VIPTGEKYGIAVPLGSALRGPVDRALAGLISDGTVERLQKKWLTTNLESLRVLR
jgi:ABC-type amino acid transport substrate-binding protein